MKVLKAGKLPKNHNEYRGRCKCCGCEVAANAGDPDLKSGYSGTDEQHGWYVDCPTEDCRRQIDMERHLTRGG